MHIMKIKMRIKTKMLFFILTTSMLIYITAIGYISISFKKRALNDAKKIADSYAKESANIVKSRLNIHFGITRAMAQSFSGYENIPALQRRRIYSEMLRNILIENPEYIAVFFQWELNAINSLYTKTHGRVRTVYHRENGEVVLHIDTLDLEGYDPEGIYYKVKRSGKEFITSPYYYSYAIDKALPEVKPIDESSILEATIIIPIMNNNKFVGLAGIDFPLESFQQIIDDIKPFKESYTFLIANNGHFVAHPKKKLINKSIAEINPDDNVKFKLAERIKNGEKFSVISKNSKFGKNSYVSFAPLSIGNTTTPWSVVIVVPVDIIMKEANKHFYISIIVGIIGSLILFLLIWFISHNITRHLKNTTILLKNLAKGRIDKSEKLPVKSNDEIGEMTRSANTLIDGLNSIVKFAKQIGEGNLSAEYSLLSKQDVLGNSLIEMSKKLKQSKEEIQAQAEKLELINKELEKLSIVARETDNAVIIMDSKGNLEWINEALTKQYEYTLEEFKKERGTNIINVSTNPNIKEIFNQCIHEKKSIVYPTLSKTRSGESLWMQTTLTPILDKNGNINKVVAIYSDISKIKEAEEEIAAQRDNLQILNAAKDKFFSIIAHDLKNPFAVLLSITESLSDRFNDLSNDEKNHFIQRINKSANLLFNLMENLLQWSMSQTGKIKYTREIMNLNMVIDDNISLLRMNAEKKNINLSSEIKPNTFIYADIDMIKIVVRNLLSNAIKFNKIGGEVKIISRKKDGFMEVSVIDSGIGLSKEDLKKLFRIDVKNVSIGTSKEEKGTGLGLILSKEYIEKNGGKMWVSSKPGKGSTFSFSLPINN